jgi:hypothetical protein
VIFALKAPERVKNMDSFRPIKRAALNWLPLAFSTRPEYNGTLVVFIIVPHRGRIWI